MVYLLKMVIFYSYVKLPEGNNVYHESKNGTYWYWSTATWSWNLRKAWPVPSAREPLQRAWRKLSWEKWMFCCVWKWGIHQKNVFFNGEHSGNALNFQRNPFGWVDLAITELMWLRTCQSWTTWFGLGESLGFMCEMMWGWSFLQREWMIQ